jgi:SH3 domain protein
MENPLYVFSDTLHKRIPFGRGAISLFVLICTVVIVSTAMAESWYIKPSAEIPLRRGQGTEFKIDAILPYGAEITVLEEDDSWVRIMTQNGTEGWILKRYISQEKPLEQLVDTLREENVSLKERWDTVTGENKEMGSRNEQLQQEFDSCVAALSETRDEFQALQEETADVIRIKNELTASQELIAALRQELSSISGENDTLKDNQSIKWFLAGGGTLIFGCIVGIASSRSRKRKSSLY